MQVEVTAFNVNTGAIGTQDITAPGLGSTIPKAVLFCWVGADLVDDPDGHAIWGWGAADGARQWAVHGRSQDGQGTTNAESMGSADRCIEIFSDSGGIDGEAQFDSFIAGGVRIDWLDTHFDDFRVIAIFFAGDDVSARVDNYVVGAQDVEVDITAPGFRPKAIIAATHGRPADGGRKNDMNLSIGAAVDNGSGYDQHSLVLNDVTGIGTTEIHSIVYNNRVGGSERAGYTIELASPDASGFSSFTRDAAGVGVNFYLALDFDNQAKAFSYPIPTGTGNQSFTGMGFQPNAVILGGSHADALNTDMNPGNEANVKGFGAFTATDEHSCSIKPEDGVTTSSTDSLAADRAFVMFDESSTSQPREPAAQFVSMDSDGFTLNYTSAAPSPTRYAWGLAFGPVAAGQPFMFIT